jgi:GT2 family glycosyltransferase
VASTPCVRDVSRWTMPLERHQEPEHGQAQTLPARSALGWAEYCPSLAMPGQRQRLAVIVVNLNAGAYLSRALESLARQSIAPMRVILVDNGSTDSSLDRIEERFPFVELVQPGRNLGFAAANNLAVRMADDCEWVALLNPDAFPRVDWLERLLAAATKEPGYAMLTSRLVFADDPERLDGTGDVYHTSGLAFRRDHGRVAANVQRPTGEVFAASGAASLYRRDAFLESGGFDERFFCYLEDVDLAFRMRLAGHRCLFVADAVVEHVGSAITGRVSDFTIFHSHRNLVWTYIKNMPGGLFWLYLPAHLTVNLAAVIGFSVHGHAGAILRAKRAALFGLPEMLDERRRLQRGRRVRALELRRMMGKGREAFTTPIVRALEIRRARGRRAPAEHA